MKKRLKGEQLPILESEKKSGVTAKAKVGRSRSERIDRQFSSHEEAVAYMHENQTNFLQKVSDDLDFAKKYLASKSLPLKVPDNKEELFSNLFDYLITNLEHGGYGLEHDSFEALAARFIWHIEEMIDQELDTITRLEHAVAFGHVTTLWDHYHTIGPSQKKNSEKPRDPLLSDIYSKLAKRKSGADLTPKELWQEFISALDNSMFTDDVKEEKRNSTNPETWSVTFRRLKGEEVSGLEMVHYKRFRDALAEKVRTSRG
ncbi:hypothetical protein JAO78_012540 [Alishewanella sp. 16-MA]|uniref:Uncharacterized protein n=1 Tax=Alishewanella maricola TaxID=2795740 RepID=A0ABS8C5L3_9ALTE|nr:hypothetical protein [Alishewanella maricola]MCB5227641.1 hypothetical protein [Alishewanella maricola]